MWTLVHFANIFHKNSFQSREERKAETKNLGAFEQFC